MKYIKLFEEYTNKTYTIGEYKDFDSLTEEDLYDIAKWGLTGEFSFSGAWDEADDNLEVASKNVVESFKTMLDEPYPEGFKNVPKVLTLYRMLSLKNAGDLNKEHLGFSWFSNIDRKDNRYFLDQLEHLRSGKVFMVTANIPISNVNIARSLWQRDCIYVENEIVIKNDTNIDVVNVEEIYKRGNVLKESVNLSEDWTHDIVEGLTAYYKPAKNTKKLYSLIKEIVDKALVSQSFESFNDFIGQHNPDFWETNKLGNYKNQWWSTLAYLLGETETILKDEIDEGFVRMVVSIMDKSIDDRQDELQKEGYDYKGYGFEITDDTSYVKIAKPNEVVIIPLDNSGRKLALYKIKSNHIKYRPESYYGGYLINRDDAHFLEEKEKEENVSIDSFDIISKKTLKTIMNSIETLNPEFDYDESIDIVYNRIKKEYPMGLKNISNNIKLYRYLEVDDIKSIDTNKLGIHFVPMRNMVDDDLLQSIRVNNKTGYVVEIKTSKDNIDKYETIVHNLEYPNECEITIKEDSKIVITSVEKY